jgi:hypothetical protein
MVHFSLGWALNLIRMLAFVQILNQVHLVAVNQKVFDDNVSSRRSYLASLMLMLGTIAVITALIEICFSVSGAVTMLDAIPMSHRRTAHIASSLTNILWTFKCLFIGFGLSGFGLIFQIFAYWLSRSRLQLAR